MPQAPKAQRHLAVRDRLMQRLADQGRMDWETFMRGFQVRSAHCLRSSRCSCGTSSC